MDKNELTERFEVVKGMMVMMDSMYGFNQSDYGKGCMQGMIAVIRALGLEEAFRKFLDSGKKPAEAEEK